MAILFVLIKCRIGSEETVKTSIIKITHLKGRIDMVTGEYDLILKLEAETSSILQKFVLGDLRKITNIRRTVTLSVINE